MAYDYQLLNVTIEGRIAWVTVDAPPINVITLPLYAELAALSKELEADPGLTVVVLKSADPDFFLAHFDVGAILDVSDGHAGGTRPRVECISRDVRAVPHDG